MCSPVCLQPGSEYARSRLQADRATTCSTLFAISPIYVVLSASFCAKDLQILAPCRFQEILRAKRRAQDDGDLGDLLVRTSFGCSTIVARSACGRATDLLSRCCCRSCCWLLFFYATRTTCSNAINTFIVLFFSHIIRLFYKI
ncbi:hypothetical protein Lsha_0130 [Legionella shakespearei DSM 23087]|uniref:Uncharacterized protein n=1 Tax=Legionella shakespearei DSM 23087 TaxID=1122169 RepID=A0A0W0ZAR8_9GAMM|nr:hypothetical protein Lsha_0130 [Legionella shakespearei DSM 23087]